MQRHIVTRCTSGTPRDVFVRHVWQHLHGDLNAVKADFMDIPVIDIAPLQELTNVTLTEPTLSLTPCINQLRHACANVGFFYIRNHSVPVPVIDSAVYESRRFFAQSESVKRSIDCRDTPNRGYFGIRGENLGEKDIGDLKEGVDIGRELSDDERRDLRSDLSHMTARNRWPEYDGADEYKRAMLAYFDAMMSLSRRLLRGIALSLGENVGATAFDPLVSAPMASLRVCHYPPQQAHTVSDQQLGAGAHTDYGMLTVLYQTSPGLQVRNRSEQWIAAPLIPDTFIVNLGDCMPRLTNDIYVSTPHRVINSHHQPIHRYSIPFFFEPNPDAIIATHPALLDMNGSSRYPPITFVDHLKHMYLHTYKRRTPEHETNLTVPATDH